jgi:hypothetical protein
MILKARDTAAILRAITAILRGSCGIILASFTILVGSVKNPSIKLLQFGSIGVVLLREKKT